MSVRKTVLSYIVIGVVSFSSLAYGAHGGMHKHTFEAHMRDSSFLLHEGEVIKVAPFDNI